MECCPEERLEIRNARRNQVGILGAHISGAALALFMNTFLLAYLLIATDNSLFVVAMYNLLLFGALFVGFAVTSYIIKRHSRVWAIRISAVAKVGSLLLVIFLQDHVVEFYMLFAALFGLAEGVYWGAILTLTSQTMGRRMSGFIVWEQVVRSVASIVFPVTLGALIQFVDFRVVAILCAVLGVILLGFTCLLREVKCHDCKPLSMTNYIRTMRARGMGRAVHYHFWLQTFHDFYRRVTLLLTVLIMVSFGDNLSLGIFGSVFAAANIAVIVIYKWAGPKRRAGKTMFWFSAVAPLAFGIALLFNVSPATIILLHVGYIALGCIVRAEADKLRFSLQKYLGDESWHTESLLLTESGFMLTRIAMPLIVLLAYFTDVFMIIQGLIVVMMAFVLVVAIMIATWHRRYGRLQHVGATGD